MMRGEYVIGSLGSLYLPSTAASWERRGATCSQEFRIKGGRVPKKTWQRPHEGMALWSLSLYSNKVDSCRTPLSFVDTGLSQCDFSHISKSLEHEVTSIFGQNIASSRGNPYSSIKKIIKYKFSHWDGKNMFVLSTLV